MFSLAFSFAQRLKMIGVGGKLEGFKKAYILFILTICYIVGELGHYLIGVTSKATARDINYGDHACQLNLTNIEKNDLPQQCDSIT